MQSNFASAFSLVKQQFIHVVETMDSIKLFGDFSILEFFIALLVMGAILPIVIITVANWSTDSFSSSMRVEYRNRQAEHMRRQEDYIRRRERLAYYIDSKLFKE